MGRGRKTEGYFITEKQVIHFKKWLIEQKLNTISFAAKCGVSRQYISGIIRGKWTITNHVEEIFLKGGYDLNTALK